MNGYVCFYKDKRYEVYADTMFTARDKVALEHGIKEKDKYKISVNLAEMNGEPVIQYCDK